MRKYIYTAIDGILSVVIALLLSNMIVTQMKEEQYVSQELQGKVSQQHVSKIMSLLQGDHEIIKSSQVKYPVYWESYAILRNEARAFTKEVIFGDSEDILAASIGQYEYSGIPGEGRPILLAGHNGSHFKQLKEFEKGDHVNMETEYGHFVYEVTDMKIMAASEFDSAILDKQEEFLIMYCCYPFDSLRTEDRYFVYAKKLEGLQIEGDGAWKE